MKKTIRTLTVMVMAVLLLTVAAIPALAAEGFDFESALEDFVPDSLNTYTLEIGEKHAPTASVWAQNGGAACYSSDESVVTVSAKGTVTAVGEGTAYVAIDTGRMCEMYRYDVVAEGAATQNVFADLLDGNPLGGFFKGFNVVFILVGTFITIFVVGIFVLVFSSLAKLNKINGAMQAIAANPCQETAEAAVHALAKVNVFVKMIISSNNGKHFGLWRDVFNHTVHPSRVIKTETKEALRQGLMRLNTNNLYPVVPVQSPEEAKEAAEAFGKGGEDNVWHNLKSLSGCDVYRNVKINNGVTTSEIDAVVVDEKHGIFLLEVKSVGGMRDPEGHRIIYYDLLKEDPANQIIRHHNDFEACFAGMNISNKMKNVLVFSWPNGEERRFLNKFSFPSTVYDAITVEQLLSYFLTQPQVSLTSEERSQLAAKLTLCSGEHIVRKNSQNIKPTGILTPPHRCEEDNSEQKI